MRPTRVPVAALVFVALVVVIELTARAHTPWFADLASWQWHTKRELIDDVGLNGTVAIFGTSVLFHGLDPLPATSVGAGRVVNLALNGMSLPQQVQLFEQRAASAAPPTLAVLEARDLAVDRQDWVQGPYFRFWATFGEFGESRFYYWEPATALTFGTNRLLTTYRYREALDNWITNSARERAPSTIVRDRNMTTAVEMRAHQGMSAGVFDERVLDRGAAKPGPGFWSLDRTGRIWLTRFLRTAASHRIHVALLVPPAPPFLAEARAAFRIQLQALIQQVQLETPGLDLTVFESPIYPIERFADPLHLNRQGRVELSNEFASWLATTGPRMSLAHQVGRAAADAN